MYCSGVKGLPEVYAAQLVCLWTQCCSCLLLLWRLAAWLHAQPIQPHLLSGSSPFLFSFHEHVVAAQHPDKLLRTECSCSGRHGGEDSRGHSDCGSGCSRRKGKPGNMEVGKLGQPSHALSPANVALISAKQSDCVL